MKQFFKFVLATMLGLFLTSIIMVFLSFAILAGIMSAAGDKDVKVDANSVLLIELNSLLTSVPQKTRLPN